MNLFQLGEFVLSSGAKSSWKIDCDALSDGDIECVANLLSGRVGQFTSVVGVPRGGLRLAAAMEKYALHHSLVYSQSCLIVNDVLTTGRSMESVKEKVTAAQYYGLIKGAVIFFRGECPKWVTPLFQLGRV